MGLLEEELKKRFSDRSESGAVDAEGIWAEVSQSLDAPQGGRPAGYARWAKIGGLALLLGGLGFFLLNSGGEGSSSEKANHSTAFEQSSSFDSNYEADNSGESSGALVSDDSEVNNNKDVKNGSEEPREVNVSTHDSQRREVANGELAGQETAQQGADIFTEAIGSYDQYSNSVRQSVETTRAPDKPMRREKISGEALAEAHTGESRSYESGKATDNVSRISGTDGESRLVAVRNASESRIETESSNDMAQTQVVLNKMDPLRLTAMQGSTKSSHKTRLLNVPLAPKITSEASYYSKKNFGPSELAFSIGADYLTLDHQQEESILDLNGLTTSIPGYSASALGTWKIDNGLRLTIGLEYAKLRSKFNIESEREIAYLDEDRLISYELDETTGDTLNPVYQDTWMTAIETRTIIHHNEFDLLGIPMRVGYEHEFGKLGLGLDVGVSYGFFLNQRGRSIDAEGSVSEFDMSGETDVPFKASLLMYSVNPMIDYQLSDDLSLRLSPSIRFLPKSDSDFHGVEQKGQVWRLGGGIVYQLR